MSKKTIAVDIDDVLSASAQGWVDYSNRRWGTNLRVDDYDEDWSKMWGVDYAEDRRRAHEFYRSGTVGTYEPFNEAKPVLEELARRYKLVITTSRVRYVQEDTLKWLDTHYKGIFEEVHLAGIFDTNHPNPLSLTKAGLCVSIGVDYLIDDHPKHCFAVAKAGIWTILFGEYAWSRNLGQLPERVTRVTDWQGVKAYFDGRD